MRDDTESIKLITSMARDLMNYTKDVSMAENKRVDLFYNSVIKVIAIILITFVIGFGIMGGCIMYALYQAYNYEGYSTNPTTIENTNITGKDNKIGVDK